MNVSKDILQMGEALGSLDASEEGSLIPSSTRTPVVFSTHAPQFLTF